MTQTNDTFFDRTAQGTADPELARKLTNATTRQFAGRIKICEEFPDVDRMRKLTQQIRDNVLCNLDTYLKQLTDNLTARGVKVHFAEDAAAARTIICDIAKRHNIQRIVKSKSMATEEIDLNPALEKMGCEVTETDLGEFIIQVAGQKPSHLVAPAVHLNTQEIAKLFREKLQFDGPADAKAMTMFARKILRGKFRAAQMGISGVNFAVADPGLFTICTNEGNGRYATTRPEYYVALMGMERIVPDLASASIILKMLSRFATGQRISQYTTFTGGPAEADGPKEVHLVILDNGRSEILKSKYWRVLRCLRCGACLNGCPVFRKVGGHGYGGTYGGPIGTMLLPLLYGLDKYPDLAKGCSLCDLCHSICPVDMPVSDILLELRNDLVQGGKTPFLERVAMKAMGFGMSHSWMYKLAQRFMPWVLKPVSKNGWVKFLPGPSGGWTKVKDLPLPARKSFLRSLGGKK